MARLEGQNLDDGPQLTKDFGFLPIPAHLRYDPAKPPHFGLFLNIAFAFASTFTVANLYYCQPLLIQLSLSFNTSDSRISRIPTLVQAGYAVGLVFISPLGDLLRRRPIVLLSVAISTCLTVGLAVTKSIVAFEVLSFFVGVVSITPQILIPLTADLAPVSRRASAISIVLSGLLFGVLIARVLAGIIAQFVTWRVVYYVAIGLQFVVFAGSYIMLPDVPSKNTDLTYFNILWTMTKFAVTEPILIQASLILIGSSACYANFWVTLTFLLGGSPYHYSTLVIGLFGLIGIVGVATGPIGGKLVDRFVPWYATLLSLIMLSILQAVQTGAGGINVAAVVINAFGIDVFRQMLQVSLTTSIFGISVSARSRINAVSILAIFLGQVMGTSAGTKIFLNFGWRASAAFSMGLYGFQLFVLFIRGPHCRQYTWFGYEGGTEYLRSVVQQRRQQEVKETKIDARVNVTIDEGNGERASQSQEEGTVVKNNGINVADEEKGNIAS